MGAVYHERSMPKSLPLHVDVHHFDRWLAMFQATVALPEKGDQSACCWSAIQARIRLSTMSIGRAPSLSR